ncbi:MAG: hypothetical protein JNK81_11445 [Anaerolineales bacterium]|nr:hypothetical protein [Anaerolineales bacterium]
MRWETRIHWIWGLLIPGRWYILFLATGVILGILILKWSVLISLTILIVFVTISILGLLDIWIKWTSFSLSLSPTGKAFLERHGLGMIAERRINLNMIGTWAFEQSFIGRILDYGSLSIGALGGPYKYENLGNFRILRRIIESQGEWVPNSRQ